MHYRRLDIGKTKGSIGHLILRIEERFPDAGLLLVCRDMQKIAEKSSQTLQFISRPIWWLRLGIFFLITLVILIVVVLALEKDIQFTDSIHTNWDIPNFIMFLESLINDLVFFGAAIFFLFRLENWIKRRSVLKDLHELRIITHVIDMHQLTKDTMSLNSQRTKHSPKRDLDNQDLCRYLQYCIEMLSLSSKVAASYANDYDDEIVLNAINEIEELTTGLSNKISQKILMVKNEMG